MMGIIVILNLLVVTADAYHVFTLPVNMMPTTESNLWTCETEKTILKKGDEGYINFSTTSHQLKDLHIKCTDENAEFKMNMSTKAQTFIQYKITVDPKMHRRWKCNGLPDDGYCYLDIRVDSEENWYIKIDGVVLDPQLSPTKFYTSLTKHEFNDGKLAEVHCGYGCLGEMAFKIKDEPLKFISADTGNIVMHVRMRTQYDGQYIDCYHNKFGLVSVLRIMLKPKLKAVEDNDWRITIDNQVWSPVPDQLIYRYIAGEKLNISCKNTLGLDLGISFSYIDRPANSMRKLHCPSRSDNNIEFAELDTDGIRGLKSANIIFWFTNSTYYELHYEYTEGQPFNLTWSTKEREDGTCKVAWLEPYPQILAQDECENVKTKQYPIAPRYDHQTVSFKWTYGYKAKEVKIVLRQAAKGPNSGQSTGTNPYIYKFYIPAGVLCCILIIILTIVTLYIKKRKEMKNVPFSEDEIQYENPFYEDCVIPTFPPQWDHYATIMESTEPNIKNMQALYAKPLPKSERTPKLNDHYSTVIKPSDEPLYHEIEFQNEP